MTKNDEYDLAFDALMERGIYELNEAEKQTYLLPLINILHRHHSAQCTAYQRIAGTGDVSLSRLQDVPFLAVRLFKLLALKSVEKSNIFKVLQSSGTTSQVTAKVFLDKATSARQSKVLVKIMQEFIGKQRLPMLIIDSPQILKDGKFSARAAGIQGMAFFGRKPVYALNQDMSLNVKAVQQFSESYNNEPVLIFGFTFMVWLHFVQALVDQKISISLPKGILIHSGGWKKLQQQQVTNRQFKDSLAAICGITRVHNFYGMAEQVGSVFVECEHGHLHAPLQAEIIIRDPYSLAPVPLGSVGLIQVLSALPTSYPGHSILTEDMGMILGVDNCPCGRKGAYFSVHGRLPKTEVRGCSDTGAVK